MPIQYPVSPGTILLCDYTTGFQPPEMVKRRPAIVVSPRIPYRDRLCTVVPLSGTAPTHPVLYQCRLVLDQALPEPFAQTIWWAKADMMATVGFGRLDLFRTRRDQTGRRKYLQPRLSKEQLEEIYGAVLSSLGLGHLQKSGSRFI